MILGAMKVQSARNARSKFLNYFAAKEKPIPA